MFRVLLFLARSGSFSILQSFIAREKSIVSLITPSNIMRNHSFRSSAYSITQNIMLNTSQPVVFAAKENSIPKVQLTDPRPMVVLLEYMNAKKQHVKKIVDIYLGHGFDVLQISLKPLQLLFPVCGSQVIARDIADFLVVNNLFSPLIVHGFSVGGYLWGETLVHFKKDITHYQPVIDRIKGQIFDSPADIEAIPTAFPSSLFPKNAFLSFHMKAWNETSTKHYTKAREAFTSGLVSAPTLFITSDADILSSPESVIKASDEILEKNLKSYVKIFDGSKHVMHFKSYPNEYVSEIFTFLSKLGQLGNIQLKAKL